MTSRADLVAALQPLLDRVGGSVVSQEQSPELSPGLSEEHGPDVVEVALPGGPGLFVRLGPAHTHTEASVASPATVPASLSDGLARLIADVERELGGDLAELPRDGKQRAVRLLEERGAFEMRRSAETVAQAMGVTRFTVYNYLNRSGRSSA